MPRMCSAHRSCCDSHALQKWGVEQIPGGNRWSYPPVSSAPWLAGNSPWLVNHHWMCFFEPSLLDLGQKSVFFEPSLKSLKTSHTSPSLISNIMFVKQCHINHPSILIVYNIITPIFLASLGMVYCIVLPALMIQPRTRWSHQPPKQPNSST